MKRCLTSPCVTFAATLLFLAAGALPVAELTVARACDEGTDQHWQLRSQSKAANEPVSTGGTRYRLITSAGQLATNSAVFEGLRLIPLAQGGENLQIHRRPSGGTVTINERVALYSYTRGAYIIRKKGPAYSLGFAAWEASREPVLPQPAGIYQWIFRSPPGAKVRDHRTRNLVTLETVGLFNTEANAFLVYDSKGRTLRWRER